ncbi:unnamed protein product [Vitrella brassicaformis CCMP3155]|uniref:Uncharacterized protein n=1 Tax=Vitrella brassicaformis (strain CCMP3155) TaxID=1169540 RepID=A0A0G4FDE1_VITBC|nr:unnamed protein product [Vitrella brassicaformis CCMP3155]|eukprot:CEM10935.1 unnamed protein product [Vitrella brassicaformis CCMP3155]
MKRKAARTARQAAEQQPSASASAAQQSRLTACPDGVVLMVCGFLGADVAAFRLTCQRNKGLITVTFLTHRVNGILRANHMDGVLRVQPPNEGRRLRRHLGQLTFVLGLIYVLENGGLWERWAPLFWLGRSHGRISTLPATLSSDDLQKVGGKAVFNGRCEAVRQCLTVYTEQTLPANHPFPFDDRNPPVRMRDVLSASFRDAVVRCMRDCRATRYVTTKFALPGHQDRSRELVTQAPPIWGCTIASSHVMPPGGPRQRVVVVCGDQPGDTFAAHIYLYLHGATASTALFTTERAQGGVRKPMTVARVRQRLGNDDMQAIFEDSLNQFA